MRPITLSFNHERRLRKNPRKAFGSILHPFPTSQIQIWTAPIVIALLLVERSSRETFPTFSKRRDAIEVVDG
jgi:hypothetical protein